MFCGSGIVSLDFHELAKALVTGGTTHIDKLEITVFRNVDSESSKFNLSMAVNESGICTFSDC